MNISSTASATTALTKAAPRPVQNAPQVAHGDNDHDADDLGGATTSQSTSRSPAPTGMGTVIDKDA